MPRASRQRPPPPHEELDATLADLSDDLQNDDRYKSLPPLVRARLVRSELFGTAFELRLQDILPRGHARGSWSGELYAMLQEELSKRGPDYTPLDFFDVLMRSPLTPISLRSDAAKLLATFKHRKPPQGIDDGKGGPIGMYTVESLAKLTDEELAQVAKVLTRLSKVGGGE